VKTGDVRTVAGQAMKEWGGNSFWGAKSKKHQKAPVKGYMKTGYTYSLNHAGRAAARITMPALLQCYSDG